MKQRFRRCIINNENDPNQLIKDKESILKKMNLSVTEFDNYTKTPLSNHKDYKSINRYWQWYFNTIKNVKSIFFFKKHYYAFR